MLLLELVQCFCPETRMPFEFVERRLCVRLSALESLEFFGEGLQVVILLVPWIGVAWRCPCVCICLDWMTLAWRCPCVCICLDLMTLAWRVPVIAWDELGSLECPYVYDFVLMTLDLMIMAWSLPVIAWDKLGCLECSWVYGFCLDDFGYGGFGKSPWAWTWWALGIRFLIGRCQAVCGIKIDLSWKEVSARALRSIFSHLPSTNCTLVDLLH